MEIYLKQNDGESQKMVDKNTKLTLVRTLLGHSCPILVDITVYTYCKT